MTNATNNTILVIGSTGKTGKRVADQLEKRGIPVRHGSRSADIPFDWDNPQTWQAGAGRRRQGLPHLLPGPGRPRLRRRRPQAHRAGQGRRSQQTGAAVRPQRSRGREGRGRRHGVGTGVDDRSVRVLRAELQRGRLARRGSRRHRVAARPTMCRSRSSTPTTSPTSSVAALTDDRHVGQLYELTGPRLLSFRDAVAEIGAAAGRDISFVSVSIEDYTAMLTEYGLPQDFIWLLNHLFTEVLGQQGATGRRRAARAGTRAQGLRRLRPRNRGDRCVDCRRFRIIAVSISRMLHS